MPVLVVFSATTNLADHLANNLGIAGPPRHEALRASLGNQLFGPLA